MRNPLKPGPDYKLFSGTHRGGKLDVAEASGNVNPLIKPSKLQVYCRVPNKRERREQKSGRKQNMKC